MDNAMTNIFEGWRHLEDARYCIKKGSNDKDLRLSTQEARENIESWKRLARTLDNVIDEYEPTFMKTYPDNITPAFKEEDELIDLSDIPIVPEINQRNQISELPNLEERKKYWDAFTEPKAGTAGDLLQRIEPIDDPQIHEFSEQLEEMQKPQPPTGLTVEDVE